MAETAQQIPSTGPQRGDGGGSNNRARRGGRGRGGRGTGTGRGRGGKSALLGRPPARPQASTLAPGPAGPAPVAQPVPKREFSTTGILEGYTSGRRFADTALSPTVKANVPFEFMSEIQSATVEIGLAGKDLLAQAKTGTGKTVAFLLPAIDRLSRMPRTAGQVSILVLSPTRELAMQIATEGQPLVRGLGIGIQHVVGGTNINSEVSRLRNQPADILVATPGRLKDHLENYQLAARIANLRFLVLDEADRLLDMGFRPDIERILQHLPDRRQIPRQAMLFSATVPPAVMQVKSMVLLNNHDHVSTLKPEEINSHLHVTQHSVVAPVEDHLAVVKVLVENDIAKYGASSKIMIFSPTARATGIVAEVLKGLGGALPVFELHSRLSQSARTKTSDRFKVATSGVMATSDVSGRGMDYPNVSLVIQVGMPQAPEDYVHRLGRTARAGTDGYGVFVLAPYEVSFLRQGEMPTMPITPHPQQQSMLASLAPHRAAVNNALDRVDAQSKAQAYQAFLGFYQNKTRITKMGKAEAVGLANHYAFQALRWRDPQNRPPPILKKTVGKMGMKGVPGLYIVSELPGN